METTAEVRGGKNREKEARGRSSLDFDEIVELDNKYEDLNFNSDSVKFSTSSL